MSSFPPHAKAVGIHEEEFYEPEERGLSKALWGIQDQTDGVNQPQDRNHQTG